jgi:hypothetical protein
MMSHFRNQYQVLKKKHDEDKSCVGLVNAFRRLIGVQSSQASNAKPLIEQRPLTHVTRLALDDSLHSLNIYYIWTVYPFQFNVHMCCIVDNRFEASQMALNSVRIECCNVLILCATRITAVRPIYCLTFLSTDTDNRPALYCIIEMLTMPSYWFTRAQVDKLLPCLSHVVGLYLHH